MESEVSLQNSYVDAGHTSNHANDYEMDLGL